MKRNDSKSVKVIMKMNIIQKIRGNKELRENDK